MSIFTVATYYVRPEDRKKYLAAMEKLRKRLAKDRRTFRSVKSWRLFSQMYGGIYTSFVDIWEYESMAAQEKFEREWMEGGKLEEFGEVYLRLVKGSTMSWSIWSPVMELK